MRDLTSAMQKHWLQVRSGQQAECLSASWQENSQHTSESVACTPNSQGQSRIGDKALRSSCMSICSYVIDLTEGGRRLHVADSAVAAMLLRGYLARSTILAWSASLEILYQSINQSIYLMSWGATGTQQTRSSVSHKVIKSAIVQQCCRRFKCCDLIWLYAGQSKTKCCSSSTQSNDLHTRHSLSVLSK